VDEIHRFNKAQQDVILPYVEDGTFVLIGATTENPSFEVVAPLLSRVRVIRLVAHNDESIGAIVDGALADTERGLGSLKLALPDDVRALLVQGAAGDGRAALTALDIAGQRAASRDGTITVEDVQQALQDRRPYHDRTGDFHYDTVSAFIKSLRGSDPDASLYWLARMIEAGEDPLFIVRRMVILAAEDVGLADPEALRVAVSCQQAVHFIGMPEGFLPMAECCLYLALAPKSNTALTGYVAAMQDAKETAHLPVPLHLRNAPTPLMRQFGHGAGYRYAHDEASHVARDEVYLPQELVGRQYYVPGALGREAELVAHLQKRTSEGPAVGDAD
jgi:putative ATPase